MERNLTSASKILVIGAAVIDMIVHIDTLPKTGEDVYGELDRTIVGGCAYNVQQVVTQFGLNHDLFAPVGTGPYAQMIKDSLNKQGIPLLVEDESQDNGWNISFVEEGGERTFLSVPGLEINWQEKWFKDLDIAAYDYIYLSGYELEGPSGEVIIEQVVTHKSPSATIIFDPSPRVKFIDQAILDQMLKAKTIVHCNKEELLSLVPGNSVAEGMRTLSDVTGEPVIVTLGAEGATYLDAGELGHVPAEKVNVVDTIGAGDSHTGAFISGLAGGFSVEEACQLGNQISAVVVQQSGGTFSLKQ